jgi:uncharacterized damage-inducible protein DinB
MEDHFVRDEAAFHSTKVGEKDTLAAFLRFHQDTLLQKIEGLDDGALRRPMVPSGLSLIGLLKHLTYVHAKWFELCFENRNNGDLPWPTNEWIADEGESTHTLIEAYRRHAEVARQVVDRCDLEALNQGWSGGGWTPGDYNLRWIVVHMIEELARHNGHADVIREQLDGATGV